MFFIFESKRAFVKLGGFSRTFAEKRYEMSLGTAPEEQETVSNYNLHALAGKSSSFSHYIWKKINISFIAINISRSRKASLRLGKTVPVCPLRPAWMERNRGKRLPVKSSLTVFGGREVETPGDG